MKPGKGAEVAETMETLVAWGIIERHILAPARRFIGNSFRTSVFFLNFVA